MKINSQTIIDRKRQGVWGKAKIYSHSALAIACSPNCLRKASVKGIGRYLQMYMNCINSVRTNSAVVEPIFPLPVLYQVGYVKNFSILITGGMRSGNAVLQVSLL